MTKLLYLVHRIPYPPNKGDKIRSFHFLKALAENYEVYLGTFIDDPEDRQYIEALKPFCKQCFCLDLQPKISRIKSLTGFLTQEALSLPYYRHADMQAWVDQVLREECIEKALVFSSPMAQYLQKYPQLHWVADFVDVDSDKWRQYAERKPWPANWVYRREAHKLLAFETRMAQRADATLFVSAHEAQLFRQLAPDVAETVGFVNNGTDTEFFDPALSYDSPFPDAQKAIVFTGAMDYWANVDAVVWFAQQVFPLIRQQCAEARFYIVGSKPAKSVQQLAQADAGVIVTGRVEDVRAYIAHADVVVAPLRIARGIQNKVLEAMAMAKPLVVTAAAMEGIQGDATTQVSVIDEPQGFAEQVLAYLRDPVPPLLSNRQYVQAEFSWQHHGEQLCRLLSGEAQ